MLVVVPSWSEKWTAGVSPPFCVLIAQVELENICERSKVRLSHNSVSFEVKFRLEIRGRVRFPGFAPRLLSLSRNQRNVAITGLGKMHFYLSRYPRGENFRLMGPRARLRSISSKVDYQTPGHPLDHSAFNLSLSLIPRRRDRLRSNIRVERGGR